MNNNALTAMTAGMTRIHNTPITEIQGTVAPQKRPTPAAHAPSVTVSLSEDVLGENSKAKQITDKFEESVAHFFGEHATESNGGNQAVNEEGSILEMAPLSLPTRADVAAFEQLLNDELAKAGVDTSIPMKLTISENGEVKVNSDHPDKEKIEAMFKDNPDLQQGYVKTETYVTLQNLYQLHQQWQQKLEGGMSEEAAGNWLINASKSAQANSQLILNNGKISTPTQNNHQYA